MYGELGVKLLLEIRKSKWIVAYNDEAIRNVVTEVDQLFRILQQSSEESRKRPDDVANLYAGLLVHDGSIRRNKRCVLAYLAYRTEQIKSLWWDTGSVIPAEAKSRLGATEQRMFSDYDKLVGKFIQKMQLSLTLDQEPPRNLWIEVRVLQDYGELQTDTGVVNLEKNSQHFLRRNDCELLIRQGIVQEINTKKGEVAL